jgi:hypothetical protein
MIAVEHKQMQSTPVLIIYKGYETKEGSEIHAHNEFMSYISYKRSV